MIETIILNEYETGLLYADGRFVRTLTPGRYRLVSLPFGTRRTVTRVDLRRQLFAISGQEMLTSDGISVRLNVSVEYRVVDAARAVHSAQSYVATFYNALQILLREEIQSRTLDTLLAERGALGTTLLGRAQADADTLGLEALSVGVKDIVLPGEVKKLLAKEAETLREGRAALAAAREETAALRARANSAKILSESDGLRRMRELEALEKIGNGAGNTVVIALP